MCCKVISGALHALAPGESADLLKEELVIQCSGRIEIHASSFRGRQRNQVAVIAVQHQYRTREFIGQRSGQLRLPGTRRPSHGDNVQVGIHSCASHSRNSTLQYAPHHDRLHRVPPFALWTRNAPRVYAVISDKKRRQRLPASWSCRTKLSVHSLVAYARQGDGLRAVAGIVSEPQVGRQCSRVSWGKSHVNDTASARIQRSGVWAAGGA